MNPIRSNIRLSPLSLVSVAAAFLFCAPANAEPWLETGTRDLRSDLELLEAYHLVSGPITTWPIPAGQLQKLNDDSLLQNEPDYVVAAAHRVQRQLIGEGQPSGLRPEADLKGTTSPDFVRDFDNSSRDQMDVRAGLVYDGDTLSAALRAGSQTHFSPTGSDFALDGTYISKLLGNWQLYGGWVDQWYGPGWVSSLILSNNARPLPKVGLIRNESTAFDLPVLRWLGPWQFNTFVGLLDGPRAIKNTGYMSVRFSFEPIQDLDVGLTRTTELCGHGQPCNPATAAFHFNNSNTSTNSTNDEAAFDIRYQTRWGTTIFAPYAQAMDEDTGPFVHSYTSYLVGGSLAGALGNDGARWRCTVEYTDSVAVLNAFDLGKKIYFASYNNYQYLDGMRYRGRSLGFSLDSDSRLLSVTDLITDAAGRTYRVAFYRADINITPPPGSLNYGEYTGSFNAVSSRPAMINEWELGLTIPFHALTLDVSSRYQSALLQSETGGRVSAEAGISYRF